jgi:hypothetical protein
MKQQFALRPKKLIVTVPLKPKVFLLTDGGQVPFPTTDQSSLMLGDCMPVLSSAELDDSGACYDNMCSAPSTAANCRKEPLEGKRVIAISKREHLRHQE